MKKNILVALLIVVGVPIAVGLGMFMLHLTNGALTANPVPVPDGRRPIYSDNPVGRLGAELGVGESYQYRNLSIFPLLSSETVSDRKIVTLDRAINRGLVEVREKGYGEVNAVRVKNNGKSYVFGLAGDMIIGAKQDRMLQHDVLLPPHSNWLEVEVFCTEHGRWQEQSDKFGSNQRVVPGVLRAEAARTGSQAGIWDGVAEAKGKLGDAAGTTALKSIYSDKAIERKSQEYLDELLPVPSRSTQTTGVLVAIGDRIVCLDVFGDHQLFSDMWEKLLRSYVMDALSQTANGELGLRDAREFVGSLGTADLDVRSTPGAGTLHRVSTDAGSGSGLVFENQIVHVDLFPAGTKPQMDTHEPTPNLQLRRGNR
jgi:hypothetical protein